MTGSLRLSAVLQVFLRYYHADELNAALQASVNMVVTCQAYVRGLVMRRRHQRELQRLTYETRRMCNAMQQLAVGASSVHVELQQKLCREDRDRKVC